MTTPLDPDALDRDAVAGAIDDAITGLDIYSADERIPDPGFEPTKIRHLRRAGPPLVRDNIDSMTLVEEDGILRWRAGFGFRPRAGRRRGRRRHGIHGTVIKQLKFESLEKNRIGAALQALDLKLTPKQKNRFGHGLRAWSSLTGPREIRRPRADGRVLLFIHGTFSNTENIFAGLRENPEGAAFFAKARMHYDQILSFDHPTVSVNPFLNAVDVARAFDGSAAEVDVICHSRGGLVTRWWAEELNDRPQRLGKLIFVGSPLAGTSLAAAPRLRGAMDYLTNLGTWLGRAGGLASATFPLLTAVTAIMRVVTTVTRVAARTPIFDAMASAIPGLAGQARTGDNPGIRRLRAGITANPPPDYFAVKGEFEPDRVGWKFWRVFQDPKGRLADWGADIIFRTPNDLVVDTASMIDLADELAIGNPAKILDFGTSNKVHHTNYFEQRETTDFFSRSLGI